MKLNVVILYRPTLVLSVITDLILNKTFQTIVGVSLNCPQNKSVRWLNLSAATLKYSLNKAAFSGLEESLENH